MNLFTLNNVVYQADTPETLQLVRDGVRLHEDTNDVSVLCITMICGLLTKAITRISANCDPVLVQYEHSEKK